MSWRTAAAILIAVFTVLVLQTVMADPLFTYLDTVTSIFDTTGGNFDGNAVIDGFGGAWMNMGLVFVFGLITWGCVRVLREELTQGRL